MEPSIFKYILRHTRRDQILIILLTGLSLPFVYAGLEVPKLIINGAIGGSNVPSQLLGFPIDQITYLFVLSFLFLLLVLVNGGFKYVINVYRGVVGERMLSRFRFDLYSRILRFPLPHFKKTSSGEIIPMITAEAEPLGGFIGDAFALPAFQGGLLLTYLFFIFNQDLWLGLAAVALYPPQMYIIPKLQKKVNELAKQRVRTVRQLADRVGESVSGVSEIHANDVSRYAKADISKRLGRIYDIRFDIYKRKFFIKFLNNFLAQLTPFFFYSIGGYFVITGELSLGALVAVLAAYKDLSTPWHELLKFYQITEDVRVKYQQIIEQFSVPDMLALEYQEDFSDEHVRFTGDVQARNVQYSEDGYINSVDGVTFTQSVRQHVCVVGQGASGKNDLAMLIARLLMAGGGRLTIDGLDLREVHESLIGRNVAYAGPEPFVFSGTLEDNLVRGLMHSPKAPGDGADGMDEKALKKARLCGNSTDDFDADWIDYEMAGVEDAEGLQKRIVEVLRCVEIDSDVYEFGLRSFPPEDLPSDLNEKILEARGFISHRLSEQDNAGLVEVFDSDSYNTNLSVAENLIFGTPVDPEFEPDQLATNSLVVEVLRETKLLDNFTEMGLKIAEIMIELFSDVEPDSSLFERFSFIESDDLPEFQRLIKRAGDTSGSALGEADRLRVQSLPFKLTVARHRLGLITDDLMRRIVEARAALMERLGPDNGKVVFFDQGAVSGALSIQDNILFGRAAYGESRSFEVAGALVGEAVESVGLGEYVMRSGLQFNTGVAGSRLSSAQKLRVSFARALLKKPDLLIANEAAGNLDNNAETRLIKNVLADMTDRGVFWVTANYAHASLFDHVYVMADGKVVDQGEFRDLEKNSEPFRAGLTG